ncbi:MAG: 30S ribosomal protein S9, partial [Corynebacterium nuruki]|nr:30S ribosomal protein S9 [Corynebacterium nuruki]
MQDNVATEDDLAAAAVSEEFVASIGDALATDEGEEAVEAPTLYEGPIQTVGRRKEAVVRIRMVQGSGQFTCNGRSLE